MTPHAPGPPAGPTFRWYLESLVEGGRQLRRIALHPLPFRVGRKPGLALSLVSESVSKEHAELFLRSGVLHVRDLGSKNGTFVNSERVGQATLREGDILHFAQVEFRLGRQEIESAEEKTIEPRTEKFDDLDLPEQFVQGTRELPELLRERQVSVLFQPMVHLPSTTLAGYEALGRGLHPRLPTEPLELFKVAAGVSAEAELSQVFREKALSLVEGKSRLPALFVNVHPAELERPGFVHDVVIARQRAPHLSLTFDIDEKALEDLERMDHLSSQLRHAGFGIAYDDFGAGQARLLELAEVPPHFLKFDMSFVRGINEALPSKLRLLTSLVSVARELLVFTVAEGVETAEEADVCMRIGFTHAQGFFFGRPRPIEEI